MKISDIFQGLFFIGLVILCYMFPMAAIPFLVSITIMVAIHEWGHLKSALRHGVTVTDYSIGMGHELFGYISKKTGIRYSIRLLPVGGYVKPLMSPDDGGEKDVSDLVREKQGIKYVSNLHPAKQIEIMGAGVFMNLLSAIFFFAMIFFVDGKTTHAPIISKVETTQGLVSELKPGDRIIAVNGEKTNDLKSVVMELVLNASNVSTITVVRDGCMPVAKCPTVDVKQQVKFQDNGELYLGFWFSSEAKTHQNFTLPESFGLGISESFFQLKMNFIAVGKIITGNIPADKALSGPGSLGKFAGRVLSSELEADKAEGFSIMPYLMAFFKFAAPISIALAFMNLLPIPVLDGGHIIFAAIQWVRGKPVSKEAKGKAATIGMFLMLSLMAFAIVTDTLKFV